MELAIQQGNNGAICAEQGYFWAAFGWYDVAAVHAEAAGDSVAAQDYREKAQACKAQV